MIFFTPWFCNLQDMQDLSFLFSNIFNRAFCSFSGMGLKNVRKKIETTLMNKQIFLLCNTINMFTLFSDSWHSNLRQIGYYQPKALNNQLHDIIN